MNVTLPNGQVINGVPDGTTKAQLAEKLKANGMDVPPEWLAPAAPTQDEAAKAELSNIPSGMRAGMDAAATVGSSLVSGPVSGLAGLVGAALPGPAGQGAAWQQKTQDALTHQPSTPGSAAIVNAVTYPFQKLAEAGDAVGGKVADATGSPALGATANTAVQAIPIVAGRVAAKARPLVSDLVAKQTEAYRAAQSRGSVKQDTWTAAANEGYKVPGSEMGGSPVGNRIESVGGKAAIGQQATIENQQITNKVARREAGLKDDDPINPATLSAVRSQLAKPYDEISSISPAAANKVKLVQQARADATAKWQEYGRSSDPKVLNEAKVLEAKAERVDELIDQDAKAAGRPDLLPALKEARVALAKNFSVERAVNLGTGDVDATVLGRMYDKGSKFTDGLETIAKFANAFPKFSRDASKVQAPGVSKSEALSAALLGISTAGATGSLYGLGAAALPLASHGARALALSRVMQPSVGLRPYSPGIGLRAARNLTDQGITDPAAIIAITEAQRKGLR